MTCKGSLPAVALVLCVSLGCTPRDAPADGTIQTSVADRRIETADQATVAVSAAVRRAQLTPLAESCLQYSVSDRNDAFSVEVRENHRRAECGGDPESAPYLFEVVVDKKTGEMRTDANAGRGEYRPLQP